MKFLFSPMSGVIGLLLSALLLFLLAVVSTLNLPYLPIGIIAWLLLLLFIASLVHAVIFLPQVLLRVVRRQRLQRWADERAREQGRARESRDELWPL